MLFALSATAFISLRSKVVRFARKDLGFKYVNSFIHTLALSLTQGE